MIRFSHETSQEFVGFEGGVHYTGLISHNYTEADSKSHTYTYTADVIHHRTRCVETDRPTYVILIHIMYIYTHTPVV